MHLTSTSEKIYIAGHKGLVGSAVLAHFAGLGYDNLVVRERTALDLRRQHDVETFFAKERPDFVILAAAKVGGIMANQTYPGEFIHDNLGIQLNVIQAAHNHAVKRLIFLGSSCIYPRQAPQPIREEFLLSGPLEPSNQWYSVAKIAGIKLCQAYSEQYGDDYVCLMPSNVYGPNDNFDRLNSHVLPALLRRFHEAKWGDDNRPVTVWGSGKPRREFLYSWDLARACHCVLSAPLETIRDVAPDAMMNVGMGHDITIAHLADLVKDVVGWNGAIEFDRSKPDGTSRKLLEIGRIKKLGWEPTTNLEEGLALTYDWFKSQPEWQHRER
ncbi:MAG TPA: GDP-L-fucose synthase [Rhodothermales bacterium]|nr:GDP-L-fucose synthase [Rhodothermales bacterium]